MSMRLRRAAILGSAGSTSTETKTVVIDISTNHGSAVSAGIRAIRFLDKKIPKPFVNEFTATASSTAVGDYDANYVFNTEKSLTGPAEGNSWKAGGTGNQRIVVVFDEKFEFDEIIIHNAHDSGTDVDTGVKDITLTTSKAYYTDTTYDAIVENGDEIFIGEIPAHVASDTEDPASIDYTAPKQTVYTNTVTYDGNTQDSGTVPIDSATYDLGDPVTVLGNTGNLAKTDLIFGGWNTAANGSGTSYAASDIFFMGDANVTLYAVWRGPHARTTQQYAEVAVMSDAPGARITQHYIEVATVEET